MEIPVLIKGGLAAEFEKKHGRGTCSGPKAHEPKGNRPASPKTQVPKIVITPPDQH